MMRTEAVSPAKACPLRIATHLISQHLPPLFWDLNKHYAASFVHIIQTFLHFGGVGWLVFTLLSWALLAENTDDGRIGHKAQEICLPPLLYLALKGVQGKWELTCCCHWHKVMSLQISPAVTLVLWPLRFKCSNTGNCWQKRPFEHWLNISRSYKKQHGIRATVGNRGSPNQILCAAIAFLFPFGGFLSPVPMQINWTGFGHKGMCDLNAMHHFNQKREL